jgi:D-alanine-D-alanine ligase-like ATP-grasp enzyme
MPNGCVVSPKSHLPTALKKASLEFPVVAKPIRGRGSQGVKVCRTFGELADHVSELGTDTMVEEFLAGTEATVTVMPPSEGKKEYWALPVVVRFNHEDGIATYSGVVAVTANSRVISPDKADSDPAYGRVSRECEEVAKLLKVKAPIRIDVRRRTNEPGSPFVLFDVNMKPVFTQRPPSSSCCRC